MHSYLSQGIKVSPTTPKGTRKPRCEEHHRHQYLSQMYVWADKLKLKSSVRCSQLHHKPQVQPLATHLSRPLCKIEGKSFPSAAREKH